MQKLEERNTYTPTSVPQARSNCDPALNREETLSVQGFKTFSNSSDAALTVRGRAGRNSRVSAVYVLNMRGKPLMPTTPRKARILLKEGKAKVVRRMPFTIQLKYPTGENKQEITLGVDSGYNHMGLSAVTDRRELYSAEMELRSDIVKLNSERRTYRRGRRSRKTWYRKPKFLNRNKLKGWFLPSIQHKLDSHIKIINRIQKILPTTSIIVEVASFDIQKIKKPEISGSEYQNGPKKNFWNVREYVLHRDGHTCQCCGGKSKDKVLEVHHLKSRQIGGDSPDNLVTLWSTCHKKISRGKAKLAIEIQNGFKAETFMTTIRWKLIKRLRELGNKVQPTYGYITKQNRIAHHLPKSHLNDAFAIAGGSTQIRPLSYFLIKQVRKCNRKLFKGNRSHIRNTAERLVHGYQRFDKVLWNNVECFVFGRRKSGYFNLRKLDGTKVHASAKVKEVTLLERASTLLIEMWLLPSLTEGVSATGDERR